MILILSCLSAILHISASSPAQRAPVSYLAVDTGTNWGEWGEPELCPEGSFASGFVLKVEEYQSGGDDTSVNGICLECTNSLGEITGFPCSVEGPWGGKQAPVRCNDNWFMTTFKLKAEQPCGACDDTAVNNFAAICEDINPETDPPTQVIEGETTSSQVFGVWTQWSDRCPAGTAVCGIQTQVESESASDDSALNNARLACCRV